MANSFSVFLVIVTLITGIIWFWDKYFLAPKRKEKYLKAKTTINDEKILGKLLEQPVWIENTGSLFPVIAVVLILRSFLYEPFQIPSGSMRPTLEVGDFILVEKFAYGLSDPLFQHKIIATGKPKRGDVVVFKYPLNPHIDYIKRVVGLPGDTVVYDRNKRIWLKTETDKNLHLVKWSNGVVNDPYAYAGPLYEATEQLGNIEHQVYVYAQRQDSVANYKPVSGSNKWVVPDGQYFVMGDNRDNSADSRYWGFVPQENLVGKAVAVWMSLDFNNAPDDWLPTWLPTGIHFNRVGSIR